jgi:hypothetical protein
VASVPWWAALSEEEWAAPSAILTVLLLEVETASEMEPPWARTSEVVLAVELAKVWGPRWVLVLGEALAEVWAKEMVHLMGLEWEYRSVEKLAEVSVQASEVALACTSAMEWVMGLE